MNLEYWLALVEKGGSYCAVLELGALIWLAKDRARILLEMTSLQQQLHNKAAEVKDLAERVITIATELRMFLFNERKT